MGIIKVKKRKRKQAKYEVLWSRVDAPKGEWYHFYRRKVFDSKKEAMRFARREMQESSGSIITKVVKR